MRGNVKEKALQDKFLFCCIAVTGSFRVVWRKQQEARSVLDPDSQTDVTGVETTVCHLPYRWRSPRVHLHPGQT